MGLYVRELGEIWSVKVQPFGQLLHQVRGPVIGERPGWERHRTQLIVEFEGSQTWITCAEIRLLKHIFGGDTARIQSKKMGRCTQAKAMVVWSDVLWKFAHYRQTQINTQSNCAKGKRDQLALQAWRITCVFPSNETNNKVQMEPAWGVMAVSYGYSFLSLSWSHLSCFSALTVSTVHTRCLKL